VLVCGGEERGTWLLGQGVASERTFAFALALTRTPGGKSLGRIKLNPVGEEAAECSLAEFFDVLRERRAWSTIVAPGLQLELSWA